MKRRPGAFANANFPLHQDPLDFLKVVLLELGDDKKSSYLKEQVFSKFCLLDKDSAFSRRRLAVEKWLKTEVRNEFTNIRLGNVDEDFNILPRVTYKRFFEVLTRYVSETIGDVAPDDILDRGSFSGGATTSRNRTESHPALKFTGKAHVTSAALPWVEILLEDRDPWQYLGAVKPEITVGNVMFTVPKNSEIDRCACKEPDLNMYLQKGAGMVIRRGLRSRGINLNDQSINQSLARKGSLDGSLATIDLSSASDSVTIELVRQCLPWHWFHVLDCLRSHKTVIPSDLVPTGEESIHENEMFSSMGNGFTFELESLIFWAIARTVCYFRGVSGTVSVYGDDIIIPTGAVDHFMFVLSFLGFEVNASKSFWEGSFRESCGGHFDDGYDVTPFYVKAPARRLIDCIHLANQVRKWAVFESSDILNHEVEELWLAIVQSVPKCFWGGHNYEDKTRLVSYFVPDNPKRLSPLRQNIRCEVGGYLLWLDSTKQRIGENASIETSYRTMESEVYRARRVPFASSYGRTAHVFLSELTDEKRVPVAGAMPETSP